jgi:hypothetical protein
MTTKIVRLYVSEKAHLDGLDTAVTQAQADEARRTLEEAMHTIAVRHALFKAT